MKNKDIIKKIKDWFDMYPPEYADFEEWDNIGKENKVKYPIRSWIANTLIPNTWWPISRTYGSIISYIRFGFFEKMHLIDTKLKPDYYDADTRLLHGMFALLVDFVEVEKAWMQAILCEDYKRPFWKLNSRFRERELGLKYLDWEITLITSKHDDLQGENAKIIKELYLWWVDIRPARMDPYDLMDDLPERKGSMFSRINEKDPERDKVYEQINYLEKDYFLEDTKMMEKLISVRGSLWT